MKILQKRCMSIGIVLEEYRCYTMITRVSLTKSYETMTFITREYRGDHRCWGDIDGSKVEEAQESSLTTDQALLRCTWKLYDPNFVRFRFIRWNKDTFILIASLTLFPVLLGLRGMGMAGRKLTPS